MGHTKAALFGYRPISSSKAAGFKSCSELSSFKGVRHFWQFMILDVCFLGVPPLNLRTEVLPTPKFPRDRLAYLGLDRQSSVPKVPYLPNLGRDLGVVYLLQPTVQRD